MTDPDKPINFIQQVINHDLESGLVDRVITRFPPEPNGYLHIGHAKSICVNFGLAEQYAGGCNLRFDDTNPEKEDEEYVNAIIDDVRWLGFQWQGDICYASDYFDQLYSWAKYLITQGKAYICELNSEDMRAFRGTLTEPGKNSPFRERPALESLNLLEEMKTGQIDEGRMTLRAKIDMASPNINMRDPVMYRIKKMAHQRTGELWNIYPSYDFAHGQEDAIEGVSHSICTLEFAANRPLYEWFVDNLPLPSQPRQYEFGRLNLNYTVTSKRKLKQLVDESYVEGWDDPRMPTISGLRRRGVSPQAIRSFCDSLAVAKTDGVVDMAQFEHFIRDDLNTNASRAMCVINPLLVTLTNYGADKSERFVVAGHPNRDDLADRNLPFGHQIYIDRNDFSEDISLSRKKFKRLVIGDYVRLRSAYIIRADDLIKDDSGEITEIIGSIVDDTVGKDAPEGIRPRGVIHWVSATDCADCTVKIYDRLFNKAAPDAGEESFLEHINPNSLTLIEGCKAELGLANALAGDHYQFEREGYFTRDSKSDSLVFNCTIGLRDNWKI
ncbi:glutamine--tRNA ligase/YqeY domain fusion protein [Porticoccaceae bacterium]|uniref:Glutamine--tRNA ligase n=1 Tax=uncultured marine bacterium MedDCM-OCT-S04-C13 TaxID=743052 RepID=D6PCQ5_9BACT|nr:glutaminyl tRNA synthetase [uncultured marine bacterium MedDCM-OCT-S04-C13]MDC1143897.1 glutamine--tRNA ligase/YqeY domain fusion protein [Porticoccaceae bacterium]